MIISNSLNADINVIIRPGNKTLLLRPCLPLPLPPLPFTRPSFYTFYSLIHLPFFPTFPFLIFLFLSFQPSFPFLSIYLPILTLISFSPSTSFFSNPYHFFPNTPHPPTPHPYLPFSTLPPSPPPTRQVDIRDFISNVQLIPHTPRESTAVQNLRSRFAENFEKIRQEHSQLAAQLEAQRAQQSQEYQ